MMKILSNPKTKKLLFYLLLATLISLGIFLLGTRFRTEDIVGFIERAGIWAPIVYIIVFAFWFVATLVPLFLLSVIFASWYRKKKQRPL